MPIVTFYASIVFSSEICTEIEIDRKVVHVFQLNLPLRIDHPPSQICQFSFRAL